MPHHELQTIHHMQEIQRRNQLDSTVSCLLNHVAQFIEIINLTVNKKAENNAVMLFS